MSRTIELPIQDCDITVRVGRDGVWISLGPNTGFHVMNNLGKTGHIIGRKVAEWCDEREKQAEQVRKDNGQFGMGA